MKQSDETFAVFILYLFNLWILLGDGPFTVFAPTNAAFSQLPSSLVQTLMDDTELLKKVLLYHVVSGTVTSNKAANNIKLDFIQ